MFFTQVNKIDCGFLPIEFHLQEPKPKTNQDKMTDTLTKAIAAVDEYQSQCAESYSKQIMDYLTTIPELPQDEIPMHLKNIMAIISSDEFVPTAKCGKKQKKQKKVIDPNAPKKPKRAPNSFLCWINSNDKRGEIKALLIAEGVNPKASAVTSRGGKIWAAMSVDDKAPFQKQYEAVKASVAKATAVYEEEMISYKQSNPSFTPPTKKTKTKKQKKVIDPNAPKKPKGTQNTYMLWLNSNGKRKEIKALLTDEGVNPKASAVVKKGSEIWNAMTVDDKAPFQKQYEAAKAARDEAMVVYEEELAAYNAKKEQAPSASSASPTPTAASSVSPTPTAASSASSASPTPMPTPAPKKTKKIIRKKKLIRKKKNVKRQDGPELQSEAYIVGAEAALDATPTKADDTSKFNKIIVNGLSYSKDPSNNKLYDVNDEYVGKHGVDVVSPRLTNDYVEFKNGSSYDMAE